jgi:NAD(P)-dependent dehydrogenase (short-subunit alcohol dehydrogenase family)
VSVAVKASELLRPGLLDGVSVLCGGRAGDSLGLTIQSACAALGAQVSIVESIDARLPGGAGAAIDETSCEAAMDSAVAVALTELGGIDLLVVGAGSMFIAQSVQDQQAICAGARSSLRACVQGAWNLTRAVVTLAFLPGGRGRILYMAPTAAAGEHAGAARAGLENLARTLSIEWARHGIRALTIAPAEDTPEDELAALAAYLASPAGDYFSGCLLDLTGPGAG